MAAAEVCTILSPPISDLCLYIGASKIDVHSVWSNAVQVHVYYNITNGASMPESAHQERLFSVAHSPGHILSEVTAHLIAQTHIVRVM